MFLLIGVGLLCSSALLFAFIYRAFRRPDPGEWATTDSMASALSLLSTALFGFGAGILVDSIYELQSVIANMDQGSRIAAVVAPVLTLVVALRLVRLPAPAEASTITPAPKAPVQSARPSKSGALRPTANGQAASRRRAA